MNNEINNQWKRREGYGGPESFPENELAAYAVGRSNALAGQEHELHLSDGRILNYVFDAETLTAKGMEGGRDETAEDCEYSASEAAPGIFFLKHGYNNNDRLTTCVVLDLKRKLVVVIDGEIPAEGDEDYRVRKSHVGGCIGKASSPGDINDSQFPPDLVGKNFVAQYSERYAWELIYMNETKVAWQGLKGNPGIGDTEDYDASSFAPGVYAVSWSEESETLAAVFLYNFSERTITGHMWGYAPDFKKFLHAPLGGKIVDPREFGLQITRPDDANADKDIKQKNIDVVLRAHHEVWNGKQYDLIPEIYAEDYQAHFICGLETEGQDGVREFISGHHKSFPDWTEKVVDIVADGDRVVTRYISTATHEGEFQGIAPTGRKIEIAEVSIHRVLNGKIVEQWGFPDGLSHIQQLTAD
jgi:predicted ester cyclase